MPAQSIAWAQLAPQLFEDVIAALCCAELPDAGQVRPSTGDGGIDVYIPVEQGPLGPCHVLQVKSFGDAGGLTSSRKRQITDAMDRVVGTLRDRLTSWRLVTPMNPTPEQLAWLADEARHRLGTVHCRWRGRPYVEVLAARHPTLVDHYLFGGRERLAAQHGRFKDMLGVIRGVGEAPLQAIDALQPLRALIEEINEQDPFFRYAMWLGAAEDSPPPPRAGAMAQVEETVGGTTVAVAIVPRFAAAVQLTPSTLSLTVELPAGGPLRAAWDEHQQFGTAVQLPSDVVHNLRIDLPGGLGLDVGADSLSTVLITPHTSPPRDQFFYLESEGDDDEAPVRIPVQVTEASAGRRGGRQVVLRSLDGVLEMQVRFAGGTATIYRITSAGRLVTAVAEKVNFLRALVAGRRYRLAPLAGHPPEWDDPGRPGGPDHELQELWQLLEDLASLQPFATSALVVPDDLDADERGAIGVAGRVARGERVVETWDQQRTLSLQIADEPSLDVATMVGLQHAIAFEGAMTFDLDDQRIELAPVRQLYQSAHVVDARPPQSASCSRLWQLDIVPGVSDVITLELIEPSALRRHAPASVDGPAR